MWLIDAAQPLNSIEFMNLIHDDVDVDVGVGADADADIDTVAAAGADHDADADDELQSDIKASSEPPSLSLYSR